MLGSVSGKQMVETSVLADEHNQVFDRSVGPHAMGGVILISPIVGGSQTAGHHGTKYDTHGRPARPAISIQNSWRHVFLPCVEHNGGN
jgi:hypothetical protein